MQLTAGVLSDSEAGERVEPPPGGRTFALELCTRIFPRSSKSEAAGTPPLSPFGRQDQI